MTLDTARLRSLAEKATGGEWDRACDSYGKVQHSRKACVFTTVKTADGERLVNIAARIENWDNAAFIAAADPSTVLALLARVEMLETALREADCTLGFLRVKHGASGAIDVRRDAIRKALAGATP